MEKVEVQKSKEMQAIEDKFTMLEQTGRIDNLVDFLAVVSDNIEMMTSPMIEKLVGSIDNITAGGFAIENATRYAKRELEKNETPSSFGLLKMLGDEEVRKGLAFVLYLTKGLGKQL